VRIIYVTAGFPYPLTSGFLRHYHLTRGLAARGHSITLLSLAKAAVADADVDHMRSLLDGVGVVQAPRAGRVRRAAGAAGGGVAAPGARILAARVGELAGSGRFDVVLLSGKETHPVASAVAGLPLVVDMCDATGRRIRRTADHERGARRAALLVEWLRMRAVERMLVRAATATTYASVRDREDTVGTRGAGVIVPNGVDAEYWQRTTSRLGTSQIAFTGAMNYRPNVDAAIQLIDEIMPRVRSRVPDARAVIVGRDPVPELLRRDAPGITTVTGTVDDVRPYLERSAVFAAPIRFGAGIQNKVLEAMSMELPVVASSLAADGLRLEDGSPPPITIADDPDATAALLLDHLRSARTVGTPHAAGRAFVTMHFNWTASIDRLERVLSDAVGHS
jgi:glycosyltransferase involved in cell wall biosynthesis